MNAICYKLQKDSLISEISWPGLLALQQETKIGHQYWLNSTTSETIVPTDLKQGLKQLDLHPLIMEDCLNPDHGTLIDRYASTVYIEFPTNAGHEYGEVAYLSIICLPSLIITIQRGDVAQLPNLITTLQHDDHLMLGNTANLLYKLIDYFIDKTITHGLAYRKQLTSLEKKVHDSEDLDPNLISQLKSQLAQLVSICEDQLYCARSLVSHNDKVIQKADQEAYFNDLVSDAEQGLRSISRLNGRVKDLQENYVMQNHDASEKRLRILTIISAIFLPLTFITGFFGMNFVDMALLEFKYGETLAIGAMILTTISLLWYFYKNGWFD